MLYQADPNADPDTSITTSFAFPTAGTFLLNVIYSDESACADPGVSATVTVQVNAPTGADLTVWNAIQSCPACAKLLHTGQANQKSASQQAALTTLRSLLKTYPSSKYAKLFRETIQTIDRQKKSH